MPLDRALLKKKLSEKDLSLWKDIQDLTDLSLTYDEIAFLHTLRKKWREANPASQGRLKIALIGAPTLFPLDLVLTHLLDVAGITADIFTGQFNNYQQEILDPGSALYAFAPDAVIIVPQAEVFNGEIDLFKDVASVEMAIQERAAEISKLMNSLRAKSTAEVIVCNFVAPGHHGLGSLRVRFNSDDFTFTQLLNQSLAQSLDASVTLCDVQFLASRFGLLRSVDPQLSLETRALYSLDFSTEIAKELAHLCLKIRQPIAKVLALDLDNTLWGGVIGDDGIEGIELGEESARARAFLHFQKSIAQLQKRGILLVLVSKNEESTAMNAIDHHPAMHLRRSFFVGHRINWQPKSLSLSELAQELNLGLDSFVFIDDNPAEIELVRQQLPEVRTILLDPNPANYVRQLQDSRYFSPRSLSEEDRQKTQQYQQENERQQLRTSVGSLEEYLQSLQMEADFAAFHEGDVARISQLINKSNQFNLTTRRRSEAEVRSLIGQENTYGFAVRLKDRFGDHGLIAVLVLEHLPLQKALQIETWVMSCRVLKRDLEKEIVLQLATFAQSLSAEKILGRYSPTSKNIIVKDLYDQLGFKVIGAEGKDTLYELDIQPSEFTPAKTAILSKMRR